MIKLSKQHKMQITPFKELTRKFEKIYNEDMSVLGVMPPDIQPRATEHIKEMIETYKKTFCNRSMLMKKMDMYYFMFLHLKNMVVYQERNREEQITRKSR